MISAIFSVEKYIRRPKRLRAALSWRENSVSDRRLMRCPSSQRLRILASCPVVISGPDDLKNSSFAPGTVIFPLDFGIQKIG
jgi:hypothetical protein